MKKTLFVLLAFVGFVFTSADAQLLQWGVVGGADISKAHFSKDLEVLGHNLKSSNMTGWYFGPKVNINVPLVGLGFDASLQYSQKKLQAHNKDASTAKTFRSIELPINLRYSFGVSSLASVYIATGPQFGWNVGNKTWKFDNVIDDANKKFKKENMNTSWNVGAGVKLLKHVELGVLYNIALSKYYKGAASKDYNFKSNSWQVQAAVLF